MITKISIKREIKKRIYEKNTLIVPVIMKRVPKVPLKKKNHTAQ